MIQVTFLGVGSAFSRKNATSSILIESGNIKMLVDCGVPVLKSLTEYGINLKEVTHIFITHLHADHIGGLEQLAFLCRFRLQHFPKIVSTASMLGRLWESSLRGGMEYIEQTPNDTTPQTLNDYFECVEITPEQWFFVEPDNSLQLFVHPSKHVLGLESYSLEISEAPKVREKSLLFTSDTRLNPELLQKGIESCRLIMHDCQLFESGEDNQFGVHASYQQLQKLSPEMRKCLWLYHYGDTPLPDAEGDGFAGFIRQFQSFTTL